VGFRNDITVVRVVGRVAFGFLHQAAVARIKDIPWSGGAVVQSFWLFRGIKPRDPFSRLQFEQTSYPPLRPATSRLTWCS
jgi:hypothetical protein